MRPSMLALVAVAAAALSACGPLIIPLPPPSPTATSMTHTVPGELSVDLGISAYGPLISEEFAIAPNVYTGAVPISLGYGLRERLELQATWGAYSELRTAGLQLGIRALETERFKAGFTVGLGGSASHPGSYSISEPTVDENGDFVYDEEGNQLYTETHIDYAYMGVAPALGARAEASLTPWLRAVGMVRISHAWTIARYGLDGRDMPTQLFEELGLGLVAEPLKGFEVGLALNGLLHGKEAPFLFPALSLSYNFPLRK